MTNRNGATIKKKVHLVKERRKKFKNFYLNFETMKLLLLFKHLLNYFFIIRILIIDKKAPFNLK